MADLIDRQAAVDALDGNVVVTSRESAQAVADYIRGCADRIRSLPSAQPITLDEEVVARRLEERQHRREHELLEFLFNIINPNAMEEYLQMYRSGRVKNDE